ncbi:hypothetical protein [uncultured Ilyobacter sp.]|uniref:hypothetical protein n=1 Tax=uncultured Ilyobacter sp. TaxID=544433 RepID=UPI0029C60949|nr:hypothetical protein [uncultured Ilyobacter sp.]
MYNNSSIKISVDNAYSKYRIEVLDKILIFNSKKIVSKKFPLVDNKCGTFFHIITRNAEDKRGNLTQLPCHKTLCNHKCTYYFTYNPLINDPKEKRSICPHRLDNSVILKNFFTQSHLKVWSKNIGTVKGRRNRVLFLDDIKNYLIILDERSTYYMLWTGYPIETNDRMNKFLREYANSKNKLK